LRQAFEVVGLTPPRHISWHDGSLKLVAVPAYGHNWLYIEDEFTERIPHCARDDALREQDEICSLKPLVVRRPKVLSSMQEVVCTAPAASASSFRMVGAATPGIAWSCRKK
jgi:hypothetical protein